MRIGIDQSVPAYASYAAERTRGLYNVEAEDGMRFRMIAELPAERDDWQIGVVVGPSGSGKTSIARGLADAGWREWRAGRWPKDQPVIEVLTKMRGDYAKATAALAAVGLGSVPSWLRPYRVLSNGEQFRASMAMLLLNHSDRIVLDEFTSVLDRQVAQVGSSAFAKSWRRQQRRVVLITPHYDILDWVQPDWWLDTAEGLDQLTEDRGVVVAREGDFQAARHHGGYPGDRVGAVAC